MNFRPWTIKLYSILRMICLNYSFTSLAGLPRGVQKVLQSKGKLTEATHSNATVFFYCENLNHMYQQLYRLFLSGCSSRAGANRAPFSVGEQDKDVDGALRGGQQQSVQ